jgi:general secretion pathway protein J
VTPRSPQQSQRIAGFTLLEAMIATALMAMVLAAIATITAQWLPNWNRGLARLQSDERLALGLERVMADLAAAQFIAAGREDRQVLFDGSDQAVTFVRATLCPNCNPSLEIVQIAAANDERGPLLLRTRAPFLPVTVGINDRSRPNFADPVVLLRAPFQVSFSYAGADRLWRTTWRREPQLPTAVKLTLQDRAKPRSLAVSTATLVHVQLAAACISAKSRTACLEQAAAEASKKDKPQPESAPAR